MPLPSDSTTQRQRLLLIVLCGMILWSDPLLQVVNRPLYVGGIPLLHGALFAGWAGLIAAVAIHVRSTARSSPPSSS